MTHGLTLLKAMMRDERGATVIEYALILGLMAIAIVAALTSTGQATSGAFQRAADGFQ